MGSASGLLRLRAFSMSKRTRKHKWMLLIMLLLALSEMNESCGDGIAFESTVTTNSTDQGNRASSSSSTTEGASNWDKDAPSEPIRVVSIWTILLIFVIFCIFALTYRCTIAEPREPRETQQIRLEMPQTPPPNYDDLAPLPTDFWAKQQSELETPPLKYETLYPTPVFSSSGGSEVRLEMESTTNVLPLRTNPHAGQ